MRIMKNKVCMWVVSLCLGATVQAQSIWDAGHLAEVKQSLQEPFYANSYQKLAERADALLDVEPLSVMMKISAPASGDKHDYMSLARYFWPDPSKPDGLPYITRDGQSNPELNNYDRNRLGETAERVKTLALTWYFSGDEKYAQKATELIRVWFLDKSTRMNPNLEYAQVAKGHDNNKGRSYGVLDTYSFVEMLDAVALLESSEAFTSKDSKQLKAWFRKLLDWMLTSPQGVGESNAKNNHGTAYDAQVIAFALYTEQVDVAKRILENVPQKRIFTQIEPDGRQPQELRRTLAFGYSQYNLTHLIDIFLMGKKIGVNIDKVTSEDGRCFYKAMDFLAQYVGKDRKEWPYQQISEWDYKQQEFCKDLYRTGAFLDTTRNDYRQLYNDYRIYRPDDLFNLLYVKATETDHAFAFASNQLKTAMKCATQAKKEKANAEKRRVIPCTIRKDGSLSVVHPNDWRSGFFAGTLWYVYDYTNDPYWRQEAISWTWPVEEAKWNKGTHDLGFMIGDSFGKAWELTGERSYKDVVIQAAQSLITRFNPQVGCIRSWDHNRDKWKFPVIIDNMMNLEMLFGVTQLTGDSIYWKIAVKHADTTMKNHFRTDYSSFHVVDYDPETGAVRQQCTHQGYSDDSFWSRGQGWGLYGYTMCYRFTKNPAYLEQAEHIADFFLGLPNQPDDLVSYWDMKDPGIPNVPRDASAAAIVASGLYELSTYVSPDKGKRYKEIADKITHSLRVYYQAEPGSNYGFLLLHSTGNLPAGNEIDVPLNYADYYYLEAMSRRAVLQNMAR